MASGRGLGVGQVGAELASEFGAEVGVAIPGGLGAGLDGGVAGVAIGRSGCGGVGGGGTSNVVLGGATPQLLYKSGTDTIGGTTWSWLGSDMINAPVGGSVKWGTGTVATTGRWRFANGATESTSLFAQRDSTNNLNQVGMGFASTSVYLCCGSGISDPFINGYIFPSSYLYLGVNRSTCLRMVYSGTVAYTEQYEPIIGGGGNPYGRNGESDFTATVGSAVGPVAATAGPSSLSKYFWYFPPGALGAYHLTLTLPLPQNYNEAYSKFVDVPTGATVTFTTGVANVTVGPGPAYGELVVGTDRLRYGGT